MQPGRLIGNRFEIDHAIGSGGMGVVYLARDTVERRRVAVKVLTDAGDAGARRRFLREAWAASQLSHPSIVRVYAHGEEADGGAWIAMEFVDGTSFAAVMDRGPLPVGEVCATLAPVARALAAAHRAGFVHRDVKPENILVRGDGRPVLVDFGITRTISHVSLRRPTFERLTETGMLVGTPEYMSPEQARGHELDGRSDQFSLAVVAYEALTGVRPFAGDNPMAIFASIIADPIVPVRERAPQVPVELADALLRALSKRPADRFATLDEVADLLDTFTPTSLRGIDLMRLEEGGSGPRSFADRGGDTVVDLAQEHPRAEPTTEPSRAVDSDATVRVEQRDDEGFDDPAARTIIDPRPSRPELPTPPDDLARTVARIPPLVPTAHQSFATPDVSTERLGWIPRSMQKGAYGPLQPAPPPTPPPPSAAPARSYVPLAVFLVLVIAALVVVAATLLR